MILLYIVFHCMCFFGAVVVSKLAEEKYIVDDAEFPIIMAIFLPWGVLLYVGGLWVADYISDNLK